MTNSPRIKDIFTAEEISRLTARSDWRGAWYLGSTWLAIGAIFALMAAVPHPLVIILGVVLLGGRQLALAVLQHEGAHRSLFASRWANDVLTDWLAARPIWLDLKRYRAHHVGHHRDTGTETDPDKSLRKPFPTTRPSLRRKLLRDAFGATGLKIAFGMLLMDLGILKWSVTSDVERLPQDGRRWWNYPASLLRNAAPMLIVNGALWATLAAAGHAWLFGIWVLAYLTALPLVTRIRSIAEHACLEETPDIFRNTRTTRAGLLARMTVAPMHVNYHLEHHLMMAVPCYRLPLMHQMLRDKGLVNAPEGYLNVMRQAGSAPAPA